MAGHKLALFSFVALVSVLPQGRGQLDPPKEVDPLRGLSSVTPVIEELGDEAKGCGLREDSLRLIAVRPLLDAGIRVETDERAPSSATFYLNVNVLRISNSLCAAALRAEAYTNRYLSLPHSPVGTQAFVKVMLWSRRTLISGAPSTFAQFTGETVKELAENLGTNFKLANQK